MKSVGYNLAYNMIGSQSQQLTAITDNLANSSTPGYKRTQSIRRPFDNILHESLHPDQRNLGVMGSSLTTDFTEGSLVPTNRTLDFAIHGRGFFTVEQNGQTYYTRNGRFNINANGDLLTAGGMHVMGRNGPISLPQGVDPLHIQVQTDGTIQSGTTIIGQLQIVAPENPATLTKAGSGLFRSTTGDLPEAAATTTILNQHIESSNSSVFAEMVELISAMRSHETAHRMIRMQDQTEGDTIQQLGSV